MNRFEVINRIRVYEHNGKEVALGETPPVLTVASHQVYSERVLLSDPNGVTITVIASDLIAAIRNATNAS